MLNAVIIDDEYVSRNVLSKLLAKHCPDVKIIADCSNAAEGKKAITELQPQLVFLDISMPGKSGIDMLRELPTLDFEIIFVTAFHEYTIQAIRFSAIDYLLKPVDAKELTDAVERVKQKISKDSKAPQVDSFLHNILRSHPAEDMQLCIPGIKGFQLVKVNDVIYCEAENTYTCVHLTDSRKILASRTLLEYENLLSDTSFFRIHKSYLINTRHLKEYQKGEGGVVVMANGKHLDVSRRKKEQFINYMKLHFKF